MLSKEVRLRNKILFFLAFLGVVIAFFTAYNLSREKKALPPVFTPATNPYAKGVYSTGIIESYQVSGANINIFPEVAGVVTEILVKEGDKVTQKTPLLRIDDSIQKATVEQLKAQAGAAQSQLQLLKAQPRKENLEVNKAQVDYAAANLKTAQDQYRKIQTSYQLNPKSVSKDQLDNAANAVNAARTNLEVARKQYDLTKAGAWVYDIRNQEHQARAAVKSFAAAEALLDKYTVRAPVDSVILAVNTAKGSFVSNQGSYGTYTQGYNPVVVLSHAQPYFAVRTFIDEILIPRLPPASDMRAQMFLRGTNVSIPLEFYQLQPYVTPKIELSNQRTERVDTRVLPVLFRFKPPENMNIYPGQLVDVYVETK
jgi:HlyD family secretion protein